MNDLLYRRTENIFDNNFYENSLRISKFRSRYLQFQPQHIHQYYMRTQLSYVHSTIQGEIMKRQHGTVPSMSSKIINDFFPFFKYDPFRR